MTLRLVKPGVEPITNENPWLEIISICQNCGPQSEEHRRGLAKILDGHFVIYGRGKE